MPTNDYNDDPIHRVAHLNRRRRLPDLGTIARYITQADLEDFRHWKITYYGERGDGMTCFIASFLCCAA